MKKLMLFSMLFLASQAQAHTGYLCSVDIRSFETSFESLTGDCYGSDTPNLLIFEVTPTSSELIGTKLGAQVTQRLGDAQSVSVSGTSLLIQGSLPMGKDAACGSGSFEKTGELNYAIRVTTDTGLDVDDPDYSLEASGTVHFTQVLSDGPTQTIDAPVFCQDNDSHQ